MADQAVFSGTSFCLTLLLARMLGPSDFGVYSSIVLFIYLMISIANSLIVQPLQVTIAHVEDEKNYMSFAFIAQFATEIIIALAILVLLRFKIEYLNNFNDFPLSILTLVSGFLFHDFTRKILLAKNAIKQALFVDSITGIIQLSILFGAYFFHKLNLENTILALGLSYIPSFIAAIFFLKPSFRNTSQWKSYGFSHYVQGRWLLMTAILQWWSNNLFVVASGAYLGMKALGAFRLAQSLFGVLNILLQTFENYVLPQAARLYKTSAERSKQYLRKISLKAALAFGGVLLVLFIFSTNVIVLAGGEKYADYGFIVKGVAILYFLIFIGYPIRMAIRILVLNRSFFIGYLLSFFFSLLTFNYLLKEWQLAGVIFGIIGNQIIILSYWQYELYKKDFVLWK